jgi:hypothetical protein
MNKRQIIASLSNIANNLDNTGLYRDANRVTQIMVKMSNGMDHTYEEMVEDDKRRKEEYEKFLADEAVRKEREKIGTEYKNLDFLKRRLEGYITRAREHFIIRKTGKKRNIFQKLVDKSMIDDAVDKFYELVATKSREDVVRELRNFIRSNKDTFDFKEFDDEIEASILNLYYHTREEIRNDKSLRTYRPFALKED